MSLNKRLWSVTLFLDGFPYIWSMRMISHHMLTSQLLSFKRYPKNPFLCLEKNDEFPSPYDNLKEKMSLWHTFIPFLTAGTAIETFINWRRVVKWNWKSAIKEWFQCDLWNSKSHNAEPSSLSWHVLISFRNRPSAILCIL